MESDEKDFGSIGELISHENTRLDEFSKEFERYLSANKKEKDVLKKMLENVKRYETNIHENTTNSQRLRKITIRDSIDDFVGLTTDEIPQRIHSMLKIPRKSWGEYVNIPPPAAQPQGQGQEQHNHVEWKFDYYYDFDNRGASEGTHGIRDNGKTFMCKCDDFYCYCFSRASYGMRPNSGVYKIEFEINHVNNASQCNVIGITCNRDKRNNTQFEDYWHCSYDYIGWSSWDSKGEKDKNVPNGLLCGYNDKYQSKNVFILSNASYISFNHSYNDRLPHFKAGDKVEMYYDSRNYILSFYKSNDKSLNAKVVNLPRNKTFYWMVGHSYGNMSITIEST